MKQLEGMKIISLLGPEFEDLEFWVPTMRLQEEGAQVVIAGLKAGEIFHGKYGVSARAEVSFDEINPAEFDAVIVPGGWAPDKLRRYPKVKEIVKDLYSRGKVIGMICHAGWVGISAGIVSGHYATGSEAIKDDLQNAGAIWKSEPAFRSGNLVWGRVVADIPDYCRELVAALIDLKAGRKLE